MINEQTIQNNQLDTGWEVSGGRLGGQMKPWAKSRDRKSPNGCVLQFRFEPAAKGPRPKETRLLLVKLASTHSNVQALRHRQKKGAKQESQPKKNLETKPNKVLCVNKLAIQNRRIEKKRPFRI